MTNSIQSHKNENQKITHEEPTKLFNTAEQICDFVQKLKEHNFRKITTQYSDTNNTYYLKMLSNDSVEFRDLLTLIDNIVIDKRLGVECYFLDISKIVYLLKDPQHISPFFTINRVPFLNYTECNLRKVFLEHYLPKYVDIFFTKHKKVLKFVTKVDINFQKMEISGTYVISRDFVISKDCFHLALAYNFNNMMKQELIKLHNVFNYFKFNFNFGGFF